MNSKDTYGMKPLIDIWFYVLYNDDMFAPAQKADNNETIRLTPREQTDLYEILSLDKVKISKNLFLFLYRLECLNLI